MEMFAMEKMPKEAKSIAMIIRRAVKKPSKNIFGWVKKDRAFRTKSKKCCPMGMHPKANRKLPVSLVHFPPSKNWVAVSDFGYWWDGLKKHELQEAIDAVWGKKR